MSSLSSSSSRPLYSANVFVPKSIPLPDKTVVDSITIAKDLVFTRCKYAKPQQQLQIQDARLRKALKSLDVVPGVYEGGMKLWECALDLLSFLHAHKQDYSLKGKRIAEIGCGHGLPAIYALMQGASHCCFQDLNEDVLRFITLPNILLNLKTATLSSLLSEKKTVSCVSGDWGDEKMSTLLLGDNSKDGKYDYIFSEDTLYSLDSMPKLLHLIKSILSPSGCALIAAKRIYFGLDGSTEDFTDLVKKDGTLCSKTISVVDDGSNIREIIQLTFKNNNSNSQQSSLSACSCSSSSSSSASSSSSSLFSSSSSSSTCPTANLSIVAKTDTSNTSMQI